MKLVHLATCVWGNWHVDMLTKIVWPCLLAPNNLPAFVDQCRATHRICTTRRDQARMRALPVFRRISDLVPVVFIDTPDENPQVEFHMQRFVAAMHEARDDGAIFFNLWPDVVFPDQLLGNAAKAIMAGRAGCMLPSFRVISETCVDDVLKRFAGAPDAPIAITPGDLVRLGVRHMHPMSATGVANAVHGRPDTGLMYHVENEGFMSRTSANWLFIDPGRTAITIDGTITTNEPNIEQMMHIVEDSDDMFFLSLAPLHKELDTFRPDHSNDELDIARLTMLPHVKISPFIEHLDRVCTRLHYGPITPLAWQPIAVRSEAAFRRVRMLRELLRIRETLVEQGCGRAARLISLALFTVRLPAAALIERPVTMFVPNDGAIEQMPEVLFERLIDRCHRRDLLHVMLSHTVLGDTMRPRLGEAVHRSLTGTRIAIKSSASGISVNGTSRVLTDVQHGRHRICIIDQVLEAGSPIAGAQ